MRRAPSWKGSRATRHHPSSRASARVFLLEVLLEVSQGYIDALRVLEKQTMALERKRCERSRTTRGLMRHAGHRERRCSTCRRRSSSAPTLQAIKNGQFVKLFEEDEELLNDVIVEYRQAS